MAWTGQLDSGSKKDVFRDSVALMGWWATLKRAVEYVLSEKAHKDFAYDRKHGTDTAGWVSPEDMGISDKATEQLAIQYVPSPARITRHLLDQLHLSDVSQWSFVDYGCGKGRVALVAAERPFQRVIGVDIAKGLIDTANANLKTYRGKSNLQKITFRCEDARMMPLPNTDTVFHFYNPFGPPIFTEVLRSIDTWQRAHQRKAKVIYLGAFQESLDVLDGFSFLQRERFVRCLEPKYSFAIYSTK